MREIDEILIRSRQREVKEQQIYSKQHPGKSLVYKYQPNFFPIAENFRGNFCASSWSRVKAFVAEEVIPQKDAQISTQKDTTISPRKEYSTSEEFNFEIFSTQNLKEPVSEKVCGEGIQRENSKEFVAEKDSIKSVPEKIGRKS